MLVCESSAPVELDELFARFDDLRVLRDREDRGALGGERLRYCLIETFDDRHHRDHGGHTHHDANQRQRCTQFVGTQTPRGDAKRFPDRRETKYVTQGFASEKHERHKAKGQIELVH